MGFFRAKEKKNVLFLTKTMLYQKDKKNKALSKKAVNKEDIFVSFKGSLSLEACLVIPLFVMFLMTIILSIEMVRLQTNVFEALHQGYCAAFEEGNTGDADHIIHSYMDTRDHPYLCLDGTLDISDISSVEGNGIIEFEVSYGLKDFIFYLPTGVGRIKDRVYGHAFTGYYIDDSEVKESDGEYVYVTATGSKFHRSAECSYIKVTPIAVGYSYMENGRNNDGAKYYACEICHPGKTGTLYVTKEGNRYHGNRGCAGLKRTLRILPEKEAIDAGYTPCSKCG